MREVFLCHSSDCLKLSGTSWGASAAYEDHFHYLTEARPRWYRSSQGAERGFCADCGAQMFYRRDGRDMISIAPGAFDEGEMLYVGVQIFRHSHPAWGAGGTGRYSGPRYARSCQQGPMKDAR